MSFILPSNAPTTVVVSESQTQVCVPGRPGESVVVAMAIPGPPGIRGADGVDGAAGPPGAGLSILGVLDSPSDLPVTAQASDAYLIGGDLWVYAGTGWTNAGPVQGPPGARGKDGQIRFTGHGAPPTVIVGSEPGDTYLDLDTGDIYKLI